MSLIGLSGHDCNGCGNVTDTPSEASMDSAMTPLILIGLALITAYLLPGPEEPRPRPARPLGWGQAPRPFSGRRDLG
jgi:hypothetical protein